MELMGPDRSSDDEEERRNDETQIQKANQMMTQPATKGATSQTTTQVMKDG